MEIESLEYMPHTDSSVLAVVGAGVNWDAFVGDTVMRGLGGLENLSLIPGTVGAAPVQNIGAYGSEVKESIEWVETLDSKHGTIRIFQKDECAFEYRDSFFKKGKGKNFIITRVAFKLNTKPVLNVQYKELAQRFAAHTQPPTLAEVRNAVIEIRKQKLPDVRDVGTAGSFFKNPIITREMYATLHTLYPEMPCFEIDAHFVKIPAAWILDNVCGFKGHQEGSVGVYKNQALVLVNNGNAHAHDIAALAQKMQSCVFEKTHISLEREVQYIAVE
jgi:UDP-N-acetylmuramate dehydrogenase